MCVLGVVGVKSAFKVLCWMDGNHIGMRWMSRRRCMYTQIVLCIFILFLGGGGFVLFCFVFKYYRPGCSVRVIIVIVLVSLCLQGKPCHNE